MEMLNHTMVTHFNIKGISDDPRVQVIIFIVVLFLYLIALGGNMTIFLLTCLDRHLHTPMYFFLGNLSIFDMISATITLHFILVSFIKGNGAIPYVTCLTQTYFFGSFNNNESVLLTVMSFDRFVAICNPLRYTPIMNQKVCLLLAIFCWIIGFLENIPIVILLSGFSCYRSNVINHFFCDIVPIMRLSCSNTNNLETLFFYEGMILFGLIPFLLNFVFYFLIIIAILKISSSSGKRKAFYTCSSHLTVLLLLYTTLVLQYQRPITEDSLDYNKFFALFNTAALPMLNPFIYSIKNKDVKSAFRRRLRELKK
ncbi:olfactory receptor 6C3-like [Pelobates fuscus]|uniref:olfactory receptor 6C3-like n=1 Tax=Pelobates fuscus TaxID=191477 RepID=UPI002FE4D0B0